MKVRFAAAILCVLAAACGSGSPTATSSAPPPTAAVTAAAVPAVLPTATPAAKATAAPTAAVKKGTFALSIVDQNGKPRAGVPVDVSGPGGRVRAVSDASGVARADVAEGTYSVSVAPGCTDALEIQTGDTGSAAVVAGQVTRGVLNIAWRHRFAPSSPAQYAATDGQAEGGSGIAHWRPNVTYEVTFTVADRCKGNAPAPGATHASYRIEPSANAQVVEGAPGKAEGSGREKLRAKCVSPGVVQLKAVDSENAAETPADLLTDATNANGYPGGRPGCSSS